MRRETYTKALADVLHHVLIGMASASALAAAETARLVKPSTRALAVRYQLLHRHPQHRVELRPRDQ